MKKLYLLLLAMLVTSVSFVLQAQEFDPAEVAVLKAIRDNAPASSPLKTEWADETQVATWAGVSWTDDAPRKVNQLNIPSKNLVSLDLTGLTSIFHLDCNSNQLTSLNVSGLTTLNNIFCYNNQLTSLNLEGLPQLYVLQCNDNKLTSLDVSGPANLHHLHCVNNQLTSLNVTGQTNLEVLYCINNRLTSINVEGFANLNDLRCYSNQLTSLNVTGAILLQHLECYYNQLPSLDLSGLADLNYLDCDQNQLSSLDLSGSTKLVTLWCSGNKLTSLNVSGLNDLDFLSCQMNQITSLNVSGLTNLTSLYCNSNLLTSLNVTGLSKLVTLYCHSNLLTSLDITGLTSLKNLTFNFNYIPFSRMPLPNPSYRSYSNNPQNKIFEEKSQAAGVEINYSTEAEINGTPTIFTWYKNDQVVGGNTSAFTPSEAGWYFCKMTNAQFPGLTLTTNTVKVGEPTVPEFDPGDVARLLTIRDNAPAGSPLQSEWADAVPVKLWPNITWTDAYPKKVAGLGLAGKSLQSLDVTGFGMLSTLVCTNNQLTSLNVTGVPNLNTLYCYYNQLTSLNLTGLTNLNTLSCYNNQLSSLDLTGLTSLRTLQCHFNFITSLDVTGLTNLEILYCYNNNMQSLNVTGSTKLRYLYCYNNALSSLDISGLTNLSILYCYNNLLTSLNVTGLTSLRNLRFQNNNIPFSAMPLANPVYSSYINKPQNKIFEEKVVCSGTVIDYSGEAMINGSSTSFTWYRNGNVIPDTDQSGKYTVVADGVYYCTMTNPLFPGVTLTTNDVTVMPVIATTTEVWADDPLIQYSDHTILRASVSPGNSPGGCPAATQATFFIGTQNMGSAPLILNTETGILEASLPVTLLEPVPGGGTLSPGIRELRAGFSGILPDFEVNTATGSMTILMEDALVQYTGPEMVATPDINTLSVSVELKAVVQDISVTDPSDPYPGDIRNARVKFVNRDDATDISGWIPVTQLPFITDSRTGVVTFNFTVTLNAAENARHITIGMVVDHGYYIRNDASDNFILTVYLPMKDFISGGGFIRPDGSAGVYASAPETRTNFGFDVKFNKKGTNLTGRMNIIFRSMSGEVLHTYQIRSNNLISLGVNASDRSEKTAVFLSKANLTDITDPAYPVSLGGNFTLQVSMTDRGTPGNEDEIGITLWSNRNELIYSSSWTGLKTGEIHLGGGNLVIESGLNTGQFAEAVAQKSAIILPLDGNTGKFNTQIYPNPFTDKVYFDFLSDTDGKATIEVFNAAGSSMGIIFNEEVKGGQEYQVLYRPGIRSEQIILYRMTIGDEIRTGKLIHQE